MLKNLEKFQVTNSMSIIYNSIKEILKWKF
jgi:hypothetical protein